jgi:hypothetical protein
MFDIYQNFGFMPCALQAISCGFQAPINTRTKYKHQQCSSIVLFSLHSITTMNPQTLPLFSMHAIKKRRNLKKMHKLQHGLRQI